MRVVAPALIHVNSEGAWHIHLYGFCFTVASSCAVEPAFFTVQFPMPLHSKALVPVAAALASLLSIPAYASCGAAYCSLNTDLAAEAAGLVEGASFDLRYESINQDQPRTGSTKLAVGEIRRHHDEVSTRNRNLIGTYSRMFPSGWGFSVAAPFVDREHVHIHNHHGAQLRDEWNFRKIGDLRVTGRYQKALAGSAEAPRVVGVIAGVKLPTGRTGVTNADGDVAERSLQPGSGTTDAILGAFFHQQLPQQGGSWFAQAQVQRALKEHDGFRPGAQFSADVGYAKAFTQKLSGIVQLNAVVKRRDRGSEAEPDDSGSRSLFLSPGISYQLTDAVRTYVFYQHPLHQHVNGVQLTPKRAIVFGLSTRF
jgi:hypothetical protein